MASQSAIDMANINLEQKSGCSFFTDIFD